MKSVRTLAPRTESEAYRDADYATPIWRCETSNQKAIRTLADTIAIYLFWVFFVYLGAITLQVAIK